jgi:hypothetical protein
MENEGLIELRAIREDMAKLQGMAGKQSYKDETAVMLYRLAGAIHTLAYHIEQLEKKADGR